MNIDEIVAQALAAAIAEGRIEAIEGEPGACHVLIQHPRLDCPMRRSQGQDERCICGTRLTITLHQGESADCEACAERPREH